MIRLGVILGCWLLCAIAACGQEKIWVALLKADGSGSCEDERVSSLAPRLRTVFGYTCYHIVHEAAVPLGEKYSQWVLPRKDFYIKLEPIGGNGQASGCVLFELYRGKKMVVTGKYKPVAERPLFICGPDYQDGRLVFLLQLVDEKGRQKPG